MFSNEDRSEFPVPRDDSLPAAVAGRQRVHEEAVARHEGWRNMTSQRHVRDLAAGLSGALWLATDGGVLFWWPGMGAYTRYASEHGLFGNSTLAVAVDGRGQAWAITAGGRLSYLAKDGWRPYEHLVGQEVGRLAVDEGGVLWAASSSGVYALGDPHQQPVEALLLPADGRGRVPPQALAVLGAGDVWLANAQGVHQHDGHGWREPHELRGVLALARQGSNLWMGTVQGLRRIDLVSGEQRSAGVWPSGEVTALCARVGDSFAARQEGVWAACGGWVGEATATSWKPLGGRPLGARITGLAPAGADTGGGEVWVATHDGLARTGQGAIDWHGTGDSPDEVLAPGVDRALPFCNSVQALAVQPFRGRPRLWIGTARGIFQLDLSGKRWRAFPNFGQRSVRALVAGGPDADLWAASWDGLHRLRGMIHYGRVPAVPPAVVALSPPGSAWPAESGGWVAAERWVSTASPGTGASAGEDPGDGIYRCEGTEWELIVSADQLQRPGLSVRPWIRAVLPGADGVLWIGTSAGLFRRDPSTGDVEPTLLSDQPIRALAFLPAPVGQICASTMGRLYLGQEEQWMPVLDLDGRTVTALTWDSRAGCLWAGTDRGLVQLVQDGDAWTIHQDLDSIHDGLGADYITALALCPGDGGELDLWIGTPNGLSCYRTGS